MLLYMKLKYQRTMATGLELLYFSILNIFLTIGAARVEEHGERSLTEIGKLYRKGNKFFGESRKMF